MGIKTLEVDEVAKALATGKLVEQIRKVVHDLNNIGDAGLALLLAVLRTSPPSRRSIMPSTPTTLMPPERYQ